MKPRPMHDLFMLLNMNLKLSLIDFIQQELRPYLLQGHPPAGLNVKLIKENGNKYG